MFGDVIKHFVVGSIETCFQSGKDGTVCVFTAVNKKNMKRKQWTCAIPLLFTEPEDVQVTQRQPHPCVLARSVELDIMTNSYWTMEQCQVQQLS
jgi:hypothetical protein